MTDEDDDRDSTLTKSTMDGLRFHIDMSAEEVVGIANCELSEQLMEHAKGMLMLAKSDWPKDQAIGFKDVGRDRR